VSSSKESLELEHDVNIIQISIESWTFYYI